MRAADMKAQLNVEGNKVFGHVGGFNKAKNHTYLIDIFESIKSNFPKSKLVLVGTGNLKEEIKKKVSDQNLTEDVLFLGLRNDVPDILQALDFLLMPSLFEGLPVSLIEAQAAGLKIFASDQIPNEADITKTISFLPIDKGTDVWVEEISRHLNHEKVNEKEAIVNANYDIEANAEFMQQFYFNCIRGNANQINNNIKA